jgi:hypothetical protein
MQEPVQDSRDHVNRAPVALPLRFRSSGTIPVFRKSSSRVCTLTKSFRAVDRLGVLLLGKVLGRALETKIPMERLIVFRRGAL